MLLLTLSLLPLSFWVTLGLVVFGMIWAKGHLRDGMGLPVIAVLGTVTAWYIVDVLYNNYRLYHWEFTDDVLDESWWQVSDFVIVFLVLVRFVHRWVNQRYLKNPSQIFLMLRNGSGQPFFQAGLHQMFWACLILWMALSIIAAWRLGSETLLYFFPFLDYRADPWARDRVGGGFDALISLASYLEMFVAATFGTLAALLKDRRFRTVAFIGCLITWPYFIFDRTRNPMLAVIIPSLLAWVFLRLRVTALQRLGILAAFFILLSAWFAFVVSNRSNQTITSSFNDGGFSLQQTGAVHHEGLNMYEELCWINTLIENGSYKPNFGERYYAELVNPIPRSLWPGKPLIGIDYAIARGQSYDDASPNGAGVGATISTGMIGQGVVNFGGLAGPAFAAFLMSLWVAVLARLDLRGQEVGAIPLYGLGLILTFNLGRDITLITLYTFVFGAIVVWGVEWWKTRSQKRTPIKRSMPSPSSRPVGPVRADQLRFSPTSRPRPR